MKKVDKQAVVFGAGISGATLARILAERQYKVIVYEKRNCVGGNVYDYSDSNLMVQKYGPHIFHSNDKEVYRFVKRFCELNSYQNKVAVIVKGQMVPFPINFKSIDILFPKHAPFIKNALLKEFVGKAKVTIIELCGSKNKSISNFANFIYKNIYENYSSKMWGTPISNIDKTVLGRVSINLNYDTNYFPEDKYQGIPVKGFTHFVQKMLDHKNIKVVLNSKNEINLSQSIGVPTFYCGPIDELFLYKCGKLPYRSLSIEFTKINAESYQDTPIVNHPSDPIITRVTEYKKMYLQTKRNLTIISKETPGEFSLKSKKFNERYYPINNALSQNILNKYLNLAKAHPNLHFLGRLAQYKYFDMDDAIKNAIQIAKKFC